MSHSPRKRSKRGEDDANETSLDYLCPKTDQCPLKTMFEFPERCMRRIFRAITVNICKHPIIYLLGYLALTSVVIVTSFILVTPTSVAVYNAYQPKLYKQRSELSNEIDASWNQFLNKSISEVSYDQFRILFYDVQMRNTTEKVNLFNGVKKVCHFVEVFNVSWAANNSTLSFSAMNEKLNYSDQIPQLCQLARKVEPYMELAEQVGVMVSKIVPFKNLLKISVFPKKTHEICFLSISTPSVESFFFRWFNKRNDLLWTLHIAAQIRVSCTLLLDHLL